MKCCGHFLVKHLVCFQVSVRYMIVIILVAICMICGEFCMYVSHRCVGFLCL